MTFDTSDQSDEETSSDQQKENDKNKDKDKDRDKDKDIKLNLIPALPTLLPEYYYGHNPNHLQRQRQACRNTTMGMIPILDSFGRAA